MANKPKKIHNRFDQWEILSVFTQSAEDYLQDNYTWRSTNFFIKCVIGILLAINAYLSHWGWPWPINYNYIVFSIFFYYIASTFYEKRLHTISSSEGKMVGEYIVDGRKKNYQIRLTEEKQDYILEEVDGESRQVLRKKAFPYLQYFTKDGIFLEKEFQQHFRGFLKSK